MDLLQDSLRSYGSVKDLIESGGTVQFASWLNWCHPCAWECVDKEEVAGQQHSCGPTDMGLNSLPFAVRRKQVLIHQCD